MEINNISLLVCHINNIVIISVIANHIDNIRIGPKYRYWAYFKPCFCCM